jgi:IS1 family transposase
MRRFGKNRNGSQRFRCDACRKTVTDETTRPRDDRRVEQMRMMLCLRMLLEGNSVRAIERITGVHRDTIIDAMVVLGAKCKRLLQTRLHRVPVENVQADEVWGFVGMKEKTRMRLNRPEGDYGDAYCFTAIERTTKLLIAWHVGKRSPEDTLEFAENLRRATTGYFQLTTDGYTPYRTMVPFVFGPRLDFAQLVKEYRSTTEEERRYSPAEVVSIKVCIRTGSPDKDEICTSHVERHNRTIRMQIRRMTRLTDAHSKKWENHEAALALFFAYYNFCRVHLTLAERAKKEGHGNVTPAMAAGLTDEPWSVQRLIAEANRMA